MALLILKNNYSLWTEMAVAAKIGKRLKVDDCLSKQLFFCEGKSRGRSWSIEGKLYYNSMYTIVMKDREENGMDFDSCYLKDVCGRMGPKHRKIEEESVVVVPQIECISDMDEGCWMNRNNIVKEHYEL
jgi:hypothetical protein